MILSLARTDATSFIAQEELAYMSLGPTSSIIIGRGCGKAKLHDRTVKVYKAVNRSLALPIVM